MTAVTRIDLSNHIKAMPPKSRGRRPLERFVKQLTNEELLDWIIGRECVEELERVLSTTDFSEAHDDGAH
jgi:hypothetical protein